LFLSEIATEPTNQSSREPQRSYSQQLLQAAQQLTNVNQALQIASRILGFIVQIIGIIAPFVQM
jgi:hypothetical protein